MPATTAPPPEANASIPASDRAGFYRDNGYLVVEDAFTPDEVAALNAEALGICRGDFGAYGGWQGPHLSESADEIMRRYLCIHFPHKIGPRCRAAVGQRVMVEALTQIIGPNVKCMQSMLFIKAAGKPGQAWHQDEDYIPTRDRSLVGGWIALDNATIENGCLWVIPGSHKPGILWPQRDHTDRQFDCSEESFHFPYCDSDAVPVPVKAGTIVFFNGYLLHRSLRSVATTGYRRALVNHYMSAESFLPWNCPKPGESMAKQDYRDIIMVAGNDPYAYKGVVEEAKPYVRASGEGGCEKWTKPKTD